MNTTEINNLIASIEAIQKPSEINQITAFAYDGEQNIHSDESIQRALDERTLQICLDVLPHRTFSATEESARSRAVEEFVAAVENLPGVVNVQDNGRMDHLEGPGRCYIINMVGMGAQFHRTTSTNGPIFPRALTPETEKFAIKQDPNNSNNWGIVWENHGTEGGYTSEAAAHKSALAQNGTEAEMSESQTWDW